MFDVQPSSTNISKTNKTFTWIINNNGVLDAITYEELNVNNNIYQKVFIKENGIITSYDFNDNIKQQIYDKYNESVKYTDFLKQTNQSYFDKLTEMLGKFSSYSNNSYGWRIYNPMTNHKFIFFLPMYLDNYSAKNIIVLSGSSTLTVNFDELLNLINLYAYDFKNFLTLTDELSMNSLLKNINNITIKESDDELYKIFNGIEKLKL
jgi:SAM-dependent MidA family methyltransferase